MAVRSEPIEQVPEPNASVPARISRVLFFLAGSHAEEALGLPQPLRSGLKGDGALVALTQLFVCAGVSSAMQQVQVALPLSVAIGGVVATATALSERAILDFDLSEAGAARLDGLGVQQRSSPTRRWLVGAARVSLAALTANFTASLLALGMFAPDIGNRLTGEWQAGNRAVYATAASAVDEMIGDQRRTAVAAARIKAEREAFVTAALSPNGDAALEREIRSSQAERTLLAERSADLSRRIAAEREDATAEANGIRLGAESSGREGRGPVFRFHDGLARQLEGEQAAMLARIQAEQTRGAALLVELNHQKTVAIARSQQTEPERDRALAQAEREAFATEAAETRMVARRGDLIEEHARADPRWRPKDTGLLARIRALDAISRENRTVNAFVLKLAMFLLALELMPILRRLLARVDPLVGSLRLLAYRSTEHCALSLYLDAHGSDREREIAARDSAEERRREEDRQEARRRRDRRLRDLLDAPLGEPTLHSKQNS